MDNYRIAFARSARKELEVLSSSLAGRIFHKIEDLAKNPRPAGCRKLLGESALWRIRVGNYRVIYSIDDDQQIVDIIHVRHRRDAYR
ncbi:MAG: type II toxin-antitoxin system RelE family toxin [Anaerolineales bacterium]